MEEKILEIINKDAFNTSLTWTEISEKVAKEIADHYRKFIEFLGKNYDSGNGQFWILKYADVRKAENWKSVVTIFQYWFENIADKS